MTNTYDPGKSTPFIDGNNKITPQHGVAAFVSPQAEIVDIGTTAPETIEIGSHYWGDVMNRNLIKAGFLINSAVDWYLDSLPPTIPEGKACIVSPHIYFTVNGTTYKVMPLKGVLCYVTEETMFYVYDGTKWVRFDALNLSPPAQTVAMSALSVHATGKYSNGDVIFNYTPTQDIAIGADQGTAYAALRTYRNGSPVTSPIENPGFIISYNGENLHLTLNEISPTTSAGPTHTIANIPVMTIKAGQQLEIKVDSATSDTFIADMAIPYKAGL